MHKITAVLLLIALLFSCKSEQDPPNILFIFADDQCYNTIHELGNQEVITPTLDELARPAAGRE